MRTRSEPRSAAAFAVSETLAGAFRKVKTCHPGDHLVLCNVQLAGHSVHRLLNGPAVRISGYPKADHSNADGADFNRQILHQSLNGTERSANSGRAFNVAARWAACQENDHA